MPGIFTLGKKERLRSRKIIGQVFAEGKKFNSGSYRINYILQPAQDEPLAFGIGVGNKSFRRAVDRNRIKRLTREAYRTQKIPLKEKLINSQKSMYLFFIYTGKSIPSAQEVSDNMKYIIEKLVQLAGK